MGIDLVFSMLALPFSWYLIRQLSGFPYDLYICPKGFKSKAILHILHITSPYYIL